MNSESTGISTTVALTGVLPFIVLVAAALSLPVCFFLLRLYRRAVLAGMDASAGAVAPQRAQEALRWIGRRYEAKKFSDQSITIDSMFLLFAVVQSIGLAFEGALWILTGLVTFAASKAAALLGFRLMWNQAGPPRTLLLLRVFRTLRPSSRP